MDTAAFDNVNDSKMATGVAEQSSKRGERFFHSVMWSWLGVAVSLFSGFFLNPYLVHKVGHVAAGVWALIFSVLDNVWMMDLGFRSATLKYTAHYRALGQPDKVNQTINTGLAFSGLGCTIAIVATLFFARVVTRFENISPEYAEVFSMMLVMVGTGVAIGSVFNLLTATLEGFQRFDLTSRIWITSTTVRALGLFGVLAAGHGLIDMGKISLAALAVTYALTFAAVRRVFPEFRLSPRLVSYAMFRQMMGYGLHTFGATFALQTLNQGAPILIGHFTPSSAFVAYFTYPLRLFQYSADMVGRVGMITGSHTAELAAKEDLKGVARLGILINRYCFMLFMPLTLGVLVYGTQLFRLWIDPRFAAMCAPILPVIALGITLSTVAQFNSGSILYGLGKHQRYAYSLMVEAALCFAGLWWAIPRYGILGAAWVTSALLVLNRGIVLSWLICRAVHIDIGKYLTGIYVSPILAAIPALLFALWIRSHGIPGSNWAQVIGGGAIIAVAYYAVAYFVCVETRHRAMPLKWVRARLGHVG
jgi:O-antigen/teichoic acid export membrane protein